MRFAFNKQTLAIWLLKRNANVLVRMWWLWVLGSIRDSIQSGKITYRDILRVRLFGNIVSYVELTGQELLDYLNVVVLKEVDSGAYAQYSGISMTVNKAAKKVENVKI